MSAGSFAWGQQRRSSWADWVVAALAVGAVVLLLVPLPPWLLDLLLAANLAMSLVLLLVALQVDSPLRVAAFPTWIVLSTLVRLALNVSSTRLILLEGYAGRVVGAYGELVAGANAIVGGVLFALLTIVQFVVIARGAERVAEVGARFVLDGLPGKQMAVDAELRAGSIDARQADLRRHELAQETQFFGAMDGAMKFVKGDVIASLLVICVNLLGGFGIGMTEHRLDALTALGRYGLLTIGDGLAAQIPALLVATAAGVLVTRVAGETQSGLGPELARQLLRHPRVLRWVGATCLLVAVAPKMPAAPFVVVALACGLASLVRPLPEADAEGPLAWCVSPDLARGLSGGLLNKTLLERFAEPLTESVFARLGLPRHVGKGPTSYGIDPALPPQTLELRLRGVPIHRKQVALEALDAAALDFAGALRREAHQLLGLEEVHRWLGEVARKKPATVREAVPGRVPLTTFAEALRLVLREQVPLTQLESVLEAVLQGDGLAPAGGSGAAPPPTAEQVASLARRASRSAFTRALQQGPGPLRFVRFDSLLEDTIREGIVNSPQGRKLALAPSVARDVLGALGRALSAAGAPSEGTPAGLVLLAPGSLRPWVRQLVELAHPDLPVVAAEELLPNVELEHAGTVTLFGESPRAASPVAAAV
jgi:type III secretion protein V